ncbi:PepSY domain-containing protein [Micromonospora sp. LOL_023]|uniref:PepSY domain-containing protein n=1 Tax=Micromonospora sp. LOL_023 TaxID=3345418 RepID=UPI003A8A26B1
MRRAVLAAIVAVGVGVPLVVGTAMASADDDRRVVRSGDAAARLEIDIDPELDAKFGPRPVNAVQAAQLVEQAFPGARVIEAELDEEDGGPIWEMEFILNGREREVDVDAVTGGILRDDD